MKKTPPDISKKLQDIRQKADIWRAGIARARAAGDAKGVAFGQKEVALLAEEMWKLTRQGKKQFWKS